MATLSNGASGTISFGMEQATDRSNTAGFSVTDLPPAVRTAFSNLRSFNKIQQAVAPTILQTDDSLVVNAPTGSGKTVILELAIAKLAIQSASGDNGFRIIYLAPTRSLCAEKYTDWKVRLAPLGIECIQYDGDNVVEDIRKLSNYQLILSTPEKWEVFTRHWADRNAATVLRPIKLFLIDEVQVIEDSERGANLELVVARMKYIDARLNNQAELVTEGDADPTVSVTSIRFIAVSACIPNVDDFARWLRNDRKVVSFSFAETDRQTTLERHVLGYPYHSSPFKFELNLNYKLPDIIAQYSRSKPTLIFCSSRKSAETTASFLARTLPSAPQVPREIGTGLVGKQLQDLVGKGVAYHHAGLLASDRIRIESSFREGHLGVLCCTSTLCMGVNLPAYLVIIKATFNHMGEDYANNYLLQMMGRAGRSQYNEHGVAVILTTEANVERYRKLVSDTLPIESQLHQKLPELLNSEIAHGIIYDRAAVREWIRLTFFYVRAQTNPGHYQLSGPVYNMNDQIERLCETTLESLQTSGLIVANRPSVLQPAPSGRLMARNHLSFKTMQLLLAELVGDETVAKMLSLIARADEFSAFKCRNNEKRLLNALNMPTQAAGTSDRSTGAECAGVRFRWPGRISTTDAKVYCLMQAVFGCLPIHDHSLHQEAAKMISLGARICRCVIGLLNANRDRFRESFRALYSATTLAQCFAVKLWENSPLVSRQLRGIGPRLAQHLADRGKSTFRAIRSSDPRELECIVKKQPPFGNELIGLVSELLEFAIELTKTVLEEEQQRVEIVCTVQQRNGQYLGTGTPVEFSLLVGDSSNRVLLYEAGLSTDRIPATEGRRWTIQLPDATVESITAHLICSEWVGLDVHHTLALAGDREIIATKQTTITSFFQSETVNDTLHLMKDMSFLGPPALDTLHSTKDMSFLGPPVLDTLHSMKDMSFLGPPALDTLHSMKDMSFVGPPALDTSHSMKDMSFLGPPALDTSRWNTSSLMERSYLLATSNGTCKVTIEPSRVPAISTTAAANTSIRLPELPSSTTNTLPLRSILKRSLDVPFRSAPFVPPRTALPDLETSRNFLEISRNDSSLESSRICQSGTARVKSMEISRNDSSIPNYLEETRETFKRMPASAPFFDENERRYLFRPFAAYQPPPPLGSWFGGSDAEDTLAYFKHCNVFVSLCGVKRGLVEGFIESESPRPLQEPRVSASDVTNSFRSFTGGLVHASGGRKRKRFDLGPAADVICLD